MLSKNIIYGDFLNYWLDTYKKPYLKPLSVKRIQAELKNVPDQIKRMRVKDITAEIIDKALAQVKLSRSRKYMYYVYHNSLKRAYCLNLTKDNVSEKIFLVRHKQKRGQALTREEQENFLQAIRGSEYENALKFLLYSGLRRTELLSIEQADVLRKDKLIKIHGTKTTASERFIPLTDKLLEIIEKQQKGAKDGLIFPYKPDTLTHIFKKYCPKHKLHDLRHTFITRCAESGVNINVTQKIVGHSTLNTTLAIYTHISDKFIQDEIKKLKI